MVEGEGGGTGGAAAWVVGWGGCMWVGLGVGLLEVVAG